MLLEMALLETQSFWPVFCLPSFLRGKGFCLFHSTCPLLLLHAEQRSPPPGHSGCRVGVNRCVIYMLLFWPRCPPLFPLLQHSPPPGAEVARALLWVHAAQAHPVHFEEAYGRVENLTHTPPHTSCIQVTPLPEQRITGWKWSLLRSIPLIRWASLFCVFMVIAPATKTVTSLSKW